MKPIAFLLTCLSLQTLQAQEATIELGPNEIGANEGWTITVTVRNEGLKSYSGFPDIPGFAKRGTSSQSQTSIMNGRMSSSQSIVMTYVPQRQGVIAVPGFSMKINDKTVSVQGMRVTVGPPVEQAPDPFSRIFWPRKNRIRGYERRSSTRALGFQRGGVCGRRSHRGTFVFDCRIEPRPHAVLSVGAAAYRYFEKTAAGKLLGRKF